MIKNLITCPYCGLEFMVFQDDMPTLENNPIEMGCPECEEYFYIYLQKKDKAEVIDD